MKITPRAATAAAFALLAVVHQAYGQEQGFTTIQPTVNAQCIDSAPVGDGFGWNGSCGCLVDPVWREFGALVSVSDNTAAILARDTPENCPSSSDSTVSIYDKSSSGVWQKSAEFSPSDFRRAYIGEMKLEDDVLEVTVYDTDTPKETYAFQRQADDSWERLSGFNGLPGLFVTKEFLDGGGYKTIISERDAITGAETKLTELSWINNNGDYKETIRNFEINDKYKGIVTLVHRNSVTVISQNANADWTHSIIPLANTGQATIIRSTVFVTDGNNQYHIIGRDASNHWSIYSENDTELPGGQWLYPIPYSANNSLLITTPGQFKTYQANGPAWQVTDQLDFSEDVWRWQRGNIDVDGNNFLAGADRANTVYAFNVSSDGIISNSSTGTASGCDYSDAGQYDGWGWNAVTGQSCPPIGTGTATNGCDYSNAGPNNGWGWNSISNTSCPPQTTPPQPIGQSSACDYSNANINNGWGWNSISNTSCPPQTTPPQPVSQSSACDYSNANFNNGWGWNSIANTSCPPLTNTPGS